MRCRSCIEVDNGNAAGSYTLCQFQMGTSGGLRQDLAELISILTGMAVIRTPSSNMITFPVIIEWM